VDAVSLGLCSIIQTDLALLQDPMGVTSAMAFEMSHAVGEMHGDLVSGDPQREARTLTKVFVASALLAAGGKGLRGMLSGGRGLGAAPGADLVKAVRAQGFGTRTDRIRFGDTKVPNQIVEGPGATGFTRTWGIKGGGTNPRTGYSLPFHFHIHRYNILGPWTWFRYTPTLPPSP
jgi:hypothetical protein